MNRFLSKFIFVALASAIIPLTAIANPASNQTSGEKSRTTELDPTHGKFNSLDSFVAEVEKQYPKLKLIVKRDTPDSYFAVFSASPTNDRIAVCEYLKWEKKEGSSYGIAFGVIGQNGKFILDTTSISALSKDFKQQTSSSDRYFYGYYWHFRNGYTGLAKIQVNNKIVAQFEITKPKKS